MSDDGKSDLGAEVYDLIRIGVGEMRRRMNELIAKPELGSHDNGRVASIAKDAAAVLGHIKRYEREVREATGRLTPAEVILYLKELGASAPDKLASLLADAGIQVGEADPWSTADDGQAGRSVLS